MRLLWALTAGLLLSSFCVVHCASALSGSLSTRRARGTTEARLAAPGSTAGRTITIDDCASYKGKCYIICPIYNDPKFKNFAGAPGPDGYVGIVNAHDLPLDANCVAKKFWAGKRGDTAKMVLGDRQFAGRLEVHHDNHPDPKRAAFDHDGASIYMIKGNGKVNCEQLKKSGTYCGAPAKSSSAEAKTASTSATLPTKPAAPSSTAKQQSMSTKAAGSSSGGRVPDFATNAEAEKNAVYSFASGDSKGPMPGALELVKFLKHYWPSTSDGIYNPRMVRGSKTVVSLHSEGRAVDWHIDAKNKAMGDELSNWFIRNAGKNAVNMGVQEVIWYKQIWTVGAKGKGWQAYSGVDPHTEHVHIGLGKWGTQHFKSPV